MAESILDKAKRVLGLTEDYDDYDDFDDYVDDSDYSERPVENPTTSMKPIKSRKSVGSSLSSDLIITVHEPLSYEESPSIVDDLREFKAVVLNFEQLDVEIKRQIFDFVSGALYALDGNIQKVNKDIFVLAPSNVEIDGLKEELKSSGVFPW